MERCPLLATIAAPAATNSMGLGRLAFRSGAPAYVPVAARKSARKPARAVGRGSSSDVNLPPAERGGSAGSTGVSGRRAGTKTKGAPRWKPTPR